MNLANIIQDRTNDGISIVDFLFAVMRAELNGFKPCHRLDAAKLLVKYELDEGNAFILNNPPEPSRPRSDTGSSQDTHFDRSLAKVIRESTDDGRSVCRFLINVMEGDLKAFGPHHSMAAARELLSRGFGKHAREEAARTSSSPRRSGEEPVPGLIRDRNPEEAGLGGSHSSLLSTHSSEESRVAIATADPEEEEHEDWARIWEEIEPIIEEAERISAEQPAPEPDPDNPPHVPDFSALDEAWENSQKWFEEWKNSIDPEEYQAIIKETSARFSAKLNMRIERRKQITADRERREKEEAEREAQQARARAEAQAKAESEPEAPPDPGPPPTREEHKRWSPTPNIPTSFRLVKCGHPRCKLHDGPVYYPEDDRNSPYYFNGRAPPLYGNYPL